MSRTTPLTFCAGTPIAGTCAQSFLPTVMKGRLMRYSLAIAFLVGGCGGSPTQHPPAAPVTLATGDEHAAPLAITTFRDDVYWVDTQFGNFAEDVHQGKVMRVPKAGGTTETLASGQTLPWAILVDDS